MELHQWELDSWDVLVEEKIDSLQPLLFPQKDESMFPREKPKTPQKTNNNLDNLRVDELNGQRLRDYLGTSSLYLIPGSSVNIFNLTSKICSCCKDRSNWNKKKNIISIAMAA